MSSKINVNYAQLLEAAIEQKNSSSIDDQASALAQVQARKELAEILERRAQLRPGEDNYYGALIWSRVDSLARTAEATKQSLSEVFDSAGPAAQAAQQEGALREFGAQLLAAASERSPVDEDFSGRQISAEIRKHWSSLGGIPPEDTTVYRRRNPQAPAYTTTYTTYNSGAFWDKGLGELLVDVRLAMKFEDDPRLDDILADVQSGKINANEFLNQVKAVLIENIDKSLEDSTNKLANAAEIVGGYHKTWPGKPGRPFNSYIISQVNRDLIELPEDKDGIYRSLVNSVSALQDKPEHEDRVSLLSEEKLLGNLTEYYARSARTRLVQEQAKKAQQEIYERAAPEASVLNASTFQQAAPQSDKPRPWYKRMFG